ncbi:hypothetical protein AB0A60_34955 [Streptomyces sp. NPDC046275]|uniref:hypothetical protein n=1 Tax=Streptomyces sp. NPDC046275 TaxID=3157201 RepID=UPI0033CEB45F
MNITLTRRSTPAAAAPYASGPREPDEFRATRLGCRQTPDFMQQRTALPERAEW